MATHATTLRKYHTASRPTPVGRLLGSAAGTFQSALIHADRRRQQYPGTNWLRSSRDETSRKEVPDDALPLSDHPLARSQRMARLEAVLLLAREPLASRRLSQLAGLADGTEARTLTRKLNHIYDESGRAYRIEEIAGGFQLLTRRKFAPWLSRLVPATREIRLSAPAMETLAVVAYRQPVMRAEVESIRGVQCGEILRQLMDRGLARIVGRSDELGRPFLYGTSKRFLQVFGLRHLDELPRADILRKAEDATSEATERSESQSIQENIDDPADQEQESPDMLTLPIDTQEENALATEGEETPVAALDATNQPAKAIFEEEPEDEDDDEEDEFDFDDDDDDEEDDEKLEEEDEFDDDEDEWEEVKDDDEEEDKANEDDEEFEGEDDDDWEDEDEDEWADDDWDDDDQKDKDETSE